MKMGTASGFCAETAPIWQFAGYVVTIFKIVIPAILIIIGVIALGKAVIADDTKEIKTAVNALIKKFIVAVCIFLLPTIVGALFGSVNYDQGTDVKQDYKICIKCIASPTGSTCKSKAKAANN